MMRRREFITLLGGAAATWPLAARAQQRERVRRVGMLLPAAADDLQYQGWVGAFQQTLAQLGWIIGSNVRIEPHWAGVKAEDIRRHAQELVASAPDVILAHGSTTARPLLDVTHTIPIVFSAAGDRVGGGIVESLARPGGNVTGFMGVEYSIGGKYLELLKEIAPNITRVAVLRDATQGAATGEFAAIQAMAPLLRVQVSPVGMRDAGEIERGLTAFARASGGLVVAGGPTASVHKDLIVSLAAHYKLPAVYPQSYYATAGGLIALGVDFFDQYRKAAGYVDRIIKGEKPADLPVIRASKFEFILNLQTARILGIEVPPTLLAIADEVIE
jgi:putative ABC transport system substrate-binding protein